MPGLRELQRAVGRAVLGQDEPSLGDAIDGDGIDPRPACGSIAITTSPRWPRP